MLSFPAPKWARLTLPKNQRRPQIYGDRYGRAASLIIPRLYLSDIFTACDQQELTRLGVTHIISAIEETANIPDSIPDENILHIRITDRMDVDILSHFDSTTQWIRTVLAESEDNVILVHCAQGISRSATIVCAYLVAELGMTGPEAIAFAQAKRGIVCPNLGFRFQLEQWETRFEDHPARVHARRKGWRSGLTEKMRQLRGGTVGGSKT
ncbi:hypothetical protein AX16_001371 [Volvariella volvacea WC 439]|nr:hypothetical protein AX16_001371 [Volvariella volvacea WC 439]